LANDYRLVAFDLRGHGMSDAPREHEAYTKGVRWAEDVHAVIEQGGLTGCLLVGWSHGSFVVADYLREHGDGALAGIVLMSWAVKISASPELRQLISREFDELAPRTWSDDFPERVAAIRLSVLQLFEKAIPAEDLEEALCYNSAVPTHARRGAGQHEAVDNSDVLAALKVPLWAAQGSADRVVLPGALGLVAAAQPQALVTMYEGVGHSPILEVPDVFNADLRAFAGSAFGRAG
jgi:pimeloyl-ACP methyl ester carboxylesterase